MRVLAFILVMCLCVGGCTTAKPVPTPSDMQTKRTEIEVLREEIEILVRRLEQLQQKPPVLVRQPYPLAEQAQDLDHAIAILKSARDRLGRDVQRVEWMTGGDRCFQ